MRIGMKLPHSKADAALTSAEPGGAEMQCLAEKADI
jgi:hypothetical protein